MNFDNIFFIDNNYLSISETAPEDATTLKEHIQMLISTF